MRHYLFLLILPSVVGWQAGSLVVANFGPEVGAAVWSRSTEWAPDDDADSAKKSHVILELLWDELQGMQSTFFNDSSKGFQSVYV